MRTIESIDAGLDREPEPTNSNAVSVEACPHSRHRPRLEDLRPGDCLLTCKDYTLLEGHLVNYPTTGSHRAEIARLIRTKLAHARVVFSGDVDEDVATGNSRVVFAVNGEQEDSRVLVHWEHPLMVGFGLPITSILGITLLGMRSGQCAPFLHADGALGHVVLKHVAFQPEAARRVVAQRIEEG